MRSKLAVISMGSNTSSNRSA